MLFASSFVTGLGAKQGLFVKAVAQYRLYAEECRRLASQTARPQDKQALEIIARAWDQVADEREAQLVRQIDGRNGLSPSK